MKMNFQAIGKPHEEFHWTNHGLLSLEYLLHILLWRMYRFLVDNPIQITCLMSMQQNQRMHKGGRGKWTSATPF